MRYICIDLKSFYASVECVERGLDPMKTNLVVADPERSEKTICLAVTPAMKRLGVKNRCRIFEIPKNINYITAPPRMQKYIDYAAEIYGVYLRFISPEDIHVYSIDEVFMDAAPYLKIYKKSAPELAYVLMEEVLRNVGIRAAAGVGSNLYLAKVALDITAKHSPNFIGVLNESLYKQKLWRHRPLSDFWGVGKRTEHTLESMGLFTMEDIAHCNEDILYRRFGINAELLIDHALGKENVTIDEIKKYHPKENSLTSGQVLMRDYDFSEARIVISEMAEQLCLDMTSKKYITDSITVSVGYSNTLKLPHVRGSTSLADATNVCAVILPAVLKIYDRITDKSKKIRRLHLYFNRLKSETQRQMTIDDILGMYSRESNMQKVMLDIKNTYGKNAVFRGMDLREGATALERNMQIGGHKSGET